MITIVEIINPDAGLISYHHVYLIAGILAFILLVYLVYTLLKPEKF